MSAYRSKAYRLYHFQDGHIVAVEDLRCEDDEAAREKALRHMLWPDAELWCGARLVFGRGRTIGGSGATCH
jgi:hypothetical protein